MRMLPSALRGDRCNGTFKYLEQCLLHAFTGNITGDRRIFALSCNLVDLVNIDNALFRTFNIIVGCLNEL